MKSGEENLPSLHTKSISRGFRALLSVHKAYHELWNAWNIVSIYKALFCKGFENVHHELAKIRNSLRQLNELISREKKNF